LDQYFMNHPQIFFGNPHEHAIIDIMNPYIRAGHLLCAAAEIPYVVREGGEFFGDGCEGLIESFSQDGVLSESQRGWIYAGTSRPVDVVQLNSISSEIFKILWNGRVLETMDKLQAFREAHKGAVLLHQGESYVVEELDLHQQIAQVVKRDVDYYTVPLKTLSVRVLEELDHTSLNGIEVFLGELEITEDYMSYKIMRQDRILGYEPLSLPPVTFRTTGFWFLIPWSIEKQVEDLGWNFSGGLHGLEHAIIGIMPFHVMCDRWDLGGLSTPLHEDTNAATIFVYDGIEGGIGLSEKGFSLIQKILTMVEELLRDCKCDVGCPACVYSPKCGNENQPMDKGAALLIVKEVLQRMSRKNQRGVIRNE
jgi:DEAD/DEAH box helicase domain-containing protein